MLKIAIHSPTDDRRWARRLEVHLKGQLPPSAVDVWHRDCLVPGEAIVSTTRRHFGESDILLLGLDADFVTRWSAPFTAAVEGLGDARRRLIPLVVGPCRVDQLPIADLPRVPADGRPLMDGKPSEARFSRIAREIHDRIDQILCASCSPAGESAGAGPSPLPPWPEGGGDVSLLDLLAGSRPLPRSPKPPGAPAKPGSTGPTAHDPGQAWSFSPILLSRLQRALDLPIDTDDPAHVERTLIEAIAWIETTRGTPVGR